MDVSNRIQYAISCQRMKERISRCGAAARARWAWFRALLKEPTTYPMFLLAIIALFLNADQNLIAPNLTQIARDFNLTDLERDTKLGGEISLGFFIVGGIAAMTIGYLTDKVNRRNLFTLVVLIGEFSCFCTLFVTDYWGLFATRAVTGVSIGGSNPLIMSMIGDMFDDRSRGKAISFISIMLSLGVALGQAVAGFIGPADVFGWRAPFVAISIPTLVLAPIFALTTKDPPRGAKEKAVQNATQQAGSESVAMPEPYQEKMDLSKLKLLIWNKTAILAFLQGLPGSLPWGVMLVFFQDFLVQDIGPHVEGGISVQQSTVTVLTFGAGAGIGIVLGGVLADRLWKRDPRYVPLLMSVTTGLGALPIYGLINGQPLSITGYAIITLPSGFLASITGTAIRTVLMNVTLPETRGTAFAFHTLFDDLGKGLGPLWVSLLIAGSGGRVPGFNYSIGGWFICSALLFIMIFTVLKDLETLEKETAAAVQRKRMAQGVLLSGSEDKASATVDIESPGDKASATVDIESRGGDKASATVDIESRSDNASATVDSEQPGERVASVDIESPGDETAAHVDARSLDDKASARVDIESQANNAVATMNIESSGNPNAAATVDIESGRSVPEASALSDVTGEASNDDQSKLLLEKTDADPNSQV